MYLGKTPKAVLELELKRLEEQLTISREALEVAQTNVLKHHRNILNTQTKIEEYKEAISCIISIEP